MKKENGQTVMVPLFQSQENIAGKVLCLIVVLFMLLIVVKHQVGIVDMML